MTREEMETEEQAAIAIATATTFTATAASNNINHNNGSNHTGEWPPPFLRRTLTYIIAAKQQLNNDLSARCRPYQFHLKEQAGTVFSRKFETSKCPFCQFHGIFVQGLWIHLVTTHGDMYHFDFVESTSGQHHITAREVTEPAVFTIEDITPLKNMTVSELIYWHHAPASVKTSVQELRNLGVNGKHNIKQDPIRDYYHFGTLERLELGEWIMSDDSEDEIDEEWKNRVGDRLLEDFEDVSAEEKSFFKLWNRFIHSNVVIPQSTLPGKCRAFVERHARQLQHLGLEEQLIWHLTNMWDEGHISRANILECMLTYHQIVGT